MYNFKLIFKISHLTGPSKISVKINKFIYFSRLAYFIANRRHSIFDCRKQ